MHFMFCNNNPPTSITAREATEQKLLEGSLQSLDWTGGLDWWTGLVDWTKNHFYIL